MDTSLASSGDDLVDGLRGTLETPRHAHNRANEARLGLALLVVGKNPIHTSNGVRGRARAIVAEDLDSDDVGTLSDAELRATSSTSNVSAVTVTIDR